MIEVGQIRLYCCIYGTVITAWPGIRRVRGELRTRVAFDPTLPHTPPLQGGVGCLGDLRGVWGRNFGLRAEFLVTGQSKSTRNVVKTIRIALEMSGKLHKSKEKFVKFSGGA